MANSWDNDQNVRDGSASSSSSASIAMMARNAASIVAIPWEDLPDGPARFCLLEMAYTGGDVGAFRAADGSWWVRVQTRTEPCAAWAARFNV